MYNIIINITAEMSITSSSSEDESNPRGPDYITRDARRRQRVHDLREVIRIAREEELGLHPRRMGPISSDENTSDVSSEYSCDSLKKNIYYHSKGLE